MKRFLLTVATLLGLAATAVPASADLTYTLNCNAAPCSVTGNYGTVTLHQTSSTTVTVTVQLAGTEVFANTGAGYAITWDINRTSVTPHVNDPSLTSVSIDAGTVSPGSFHVENFTSGQTYTASPFTSGGNGSAFNYAIDYTGHTGTVGDNKLVFDVSLSTGLAISDFVGNTAYIFAVDILGSPCGGSGATCNVAAKIPEPATWLIFFAGLAGLTFMMQRRRKLVRAV